VVDPAPSGESGASSSPFREAVANEHLVLWQAADGSGELLWPEPLPDGDVIDLSAVVVLGTWAYDLLRRRPGQAVVGANPALRRQLDAAGLPLLWRDPTVRIGVSHRERDELLAGPTSA
jgi:hypothetical protein